MDLKTFIEDAARRDALAAAVNTSAQYLYQIANGWRGRRASTALAQAINRESEQIGPVAVPLWSMRPDVWPAPDADAAEAA